MIPTGIEIIQVILAINSLSYTFQMFTVGLDGESKKELLINYIAFQIAGIYFLNVGAAEYSKSIRRSGSNEDVEQMKNQLSEAMDKLQEDDN